MRYAVEKLSDFIVKESFQEKVKLWLDVKWKDAQNKWSVMRDGIIDSAEVVLGKSKKYKSDWFRESAVKLDPLIEEKQRSFRKLLNNRCSENIRGPAHQSKERLGKQRIIGLWIRLSR